MNTEVPEKRQGGAEPGFPKAVFMDGRDKPGHDDP